MHVLALVHDDCYHNEHENILTSMVVVHRLALIQVLVRYLSAPSFKGHIRAIGGFKIFIISMWVVNCHVIILSYHELSFEGHIFINDIQFAYNLHFHPDGVALVTRSIVFHISFNPQIKQISGLTCHLYWWSSPCHQGDILRVLLKPCRCSFLFHPCCCICNTAKYLINVLTIVQGYNDKT